MKPTSILAWVLLTVFLQACGKEPSTIGATQVVVTVRSDLGSELTHINAAVFDAEGLRSGDAWEFDTSRYSLPFSFTVVPIPASTMSFRLVLTGRTRTAKQVESKAVIPFVRRTTVGIEMWLSANCLGRTCNPGQTCLSSEGPEEPPCVAVPVLEGAAVVPGEELSGARDGVRAEDGGTLLSDATSGDTGSNEAPSTTACLGNAGKAVCTDSVMSHCNEQAEITKQDKCATARQCQLGLASKACAPCNPGTFRCIGARLERCTGDGAQWDLVKTCDSESLCNTVAGDCAVGACSAATRVCMMNDLYGCSEDASRLERLETCLPGLCDQSGGQCDRCVANARTCSNNYVESCDGQGQMLTRTQCTGAMPKCSGGQCVQCTVAGDCPTPANTCAQPTCNAVTARCGSVNTPEHTPCATGVCNASGACVECVVDTACRTPGLSRCLSSRCVQCRETSHCPAGSECNLSNNTCQRVSLAGTGTACTSYAAMSGSRCAGFYCGVTQAQVASALTQTGACRLPADLVCADTLGKITSVCARETKSANPMDSNEALRPRIAACVRARNEVQSVTISDACLGCYLDRAQCSADRCLVDCLLGDSASCDACQRTNNCFQPLYACSGLPSPL